MTAFEVRCSEIAEAKGKEPDQARLLKLLDLCWQQRLEDDPELATEVGQPGYDDRWQDWSEAAIARRKRELEAPALALATIDRAKLDSAGQIDWDLFKRDLDERLEARRFPSELLPLSQMEGPQQLVPRILSMMPAARVEDFQYRTARLQAVPKLLDQVIVLLDKGLAAGITPPKVTLRDVPRQVRDLITAGPEKSPLLEAFRRMPAIIPATEQERLRLKAAGVIDSAVHPAFRKLAEFLETRYLPGARETTACRDLKDGEAWYAFRVRRETTTAQSPQRIHELGLAEVKRLRAEMDAVITSTGFQGGFEDFCRFLRTDPQFYFDRPEDLLAAYREVCKRIDPELPRLFGRLPRLTYGVKEVPAASAPSQTTAYYEPGSPKSGRPGWYYANTYRLDQRPKWEIDALSLHEAVPGHHLQISLAQELEGLPEWRRHAGFTAYVEGWALYAESLGEEIGLYRDRYSKFGQLTYEMWRAVRLVVDTGLHALGWTREQAIDFFKRNSSKTEHDIMVEIDRYLVWPGQALAYKIGELKIKELRDFARRELDPAFDVRAFHDAILGAGALPLDVLESRLRAWVAARKPRSAR